MDLGAIALLTAYLAAAVKMSTPLVLAGIGETISEKAGILNISVEGNMLAGAFAGFIVAYHTNNLFLGVLAGMAGGMLVSLLHGTMSVKIKADQTIVGLALNFLVLGLTSFLFYLAFGRTDQLPSCPTVAKMEIPLLSKIPVIGPALFSQDLFVYVAFLSVIVLALIFYKTEWGINIHAVGEHPRAADTAGINVFGIRYLASMLNGLFGGLGGACMTLGQFGFFIENITAGRGYIALAVVILGRRNPLGVFVAALIIGFAEALQYSLQTLGVPIPSQVFTMFPYVVAVVVLLLSIGKSTVPAALGVPYERNQR
ncbi:MAG TPA: ABC transporter permease [Clostridia bacterium]|nr:ABC transporter permease [Clostridia bacterium]